MKIISIEGLDKAGKCTISNMISSHLMGLGYRVEKSEFHRYDTPTGDLIRKWLIGEWIADQITIELIMSADKQAQQNWFNELEAKGVDYLILDRYTLSQSAYSVANGIDSKWLTSVTKYMRKPDIDIIIDIPADTSMKRKGKHNAGINDKYESDLKLLSKVRDLYIGMSTAYSAPKKYVVDGDWDIEDVFKSVLEIIKRECL